MNSKPHRRSNITTTHKINQEPFLYLSYVIKSSLDAVPKVARPPPLFFDLTDLSFEGGEKCHYVNVENAIQTTNVQDDRTP